MNKNHSNSSFYTEETVTLNNEHQEEEIFQDSYNEINEQIEQNPTLN